MPLLAFAEGADVRLPLTFAELHLGEKGAEGRIFRAAGVDTHGDLARRDGHMADAHLVEGLAVKRALDAEVVFAAAEAVPDAMDGRVDGGRRPIGIAAHRHHAAEVLEGLRLVLCRRLDPAFRAEIDGDAALVEAPLAVELRLDGKGKKLFTRRKLQDGRAVVAEMVVGALPQVCVRLGHDLDRVRADPILRGFARPLPLHFVDSHTFLPVNKIFLADPRGHTDAADGSDLVLLRVPSRVAQGACPES